MNPGLTLIKRVSFNLQIYAIVLYKVPNPCMDMCAYFKLPTCHMKTQICEVKVSDTCISSNTCCQRIKENN
jgi:hypothetical protein